MHTMRPLINSHIVNIQIYGDGRALCIRRAAILFMFQRISFVNFVLQDLTCEVTYAEGPKLLASERSLTGFNTGIIMPSFHVGGK
jgi:hypothetical protein